VARVYASGEETMINYAVLTKEGLLTANREVKPFGPPKLYTTEQNAQRAIDTNVGTQLKGGTVVEIEWREKKR
jgi:hypothetical protein